MKKGFTMAEVLITIGIIGLVAAITIPILIKNYQERQFKTAYKKAYSEISQIFAEAIYNQQLSRTQKSDINAINEEFGLLKTKLKVLHECNQKGVIEECWIEGDKVCGGGCATGNSSDGIAKEGTGVLGQGREYCFIDISGRSWCTFHENENIFFVDTNGFKQPNRFGKDRFMFTIADVNNNRAKSATNYKKIIPLKNEDILSEGYWCVHPPCYYQSWLLE